MEKPLAVVHTEEEKHPAVLPLQYQEGGERDEWSGWAGLGQAGLGWASLPRWELLGGRLIRCQAKCFTCINSSNPHSSLETYRSYYNPPLHQAAEARGG